jgi:hypothetical protein
MISRPSLDDTGLRGTLAALQAATAMNEMAQRLKMQREQIAASQGQHMMDLLANLGMNQVRYGQQKELLGLEQAGRMALEDQRYQRSLDLNNTIDQNILKRKSVYETGLTPDEISAYAEQMSNMPRGKPVLASEVAQHFKFLKQQAEIVNELKSKGMQPETYRYTEPSAAGPRTDAPIPSPTAFSDWAGNLAAGQPQSPSDLIPDSAYLTAMDQYQDKLRQQKFLDENTELGLSEADRQKLLEIANSISKVRNDPRLTDVQKQQALDYWQGEMSLIHGVRLPKPKPPPTLAEQVQQNPPIPAEAVLGPKWAGKVITGVARDGSYRFEDAPKESTTPQLHPAADPGRPYNQLPDKIKSEVFKESQSVYLAMRKKVDENGTEIPFEGFDIGQLAKIQDQLAMSRLGIAPPPASQPTTEPSRPLPTMDDLVRNLMTGGTPQGTVEALVGRGMAPQQAMAAVQEAQQRVVAIQEEQAQKHIAALHREYPDLSKAPLEVQAQMRQLLQAVAGQAPTMPRQYSNRGR